MGKTATSSEGFMADGQYTPHMAVKIKTVVPDNGELTLTLPFAAGREVEIIVMAQGATLTHLPDSHPADDGALSDAPLVATEEKSVDPRHVSEVLRELSDELITRYETLFRVERKSPDNPES
jgi:hypothetical protein